jgi:hypothetical protein
MTPNLGDLLAAALASGSAQAPAETLRDVVALLARISSGSPPSSRASSASPELSSVLWWADARAPTRSRSPSPPPWTAGGLAGPQEEEDVRPFTDTTTH